MYSKNELCEMIRSIYPDIGLCGIDLDADYDEPKHRWVLTFRRDNEVIKSFLEPREAEMCLKGERCLNFVMQLDEFKKKIDLLPKKPTTPGDDN